MTEVTERAKLPVLTLSYSDLITVARLQVRIPDLGDRRAAGADVAARSDEAREKASGKRPKTVAIIMDNTAASVASVKPMREQLLKELGLDSWWWTRPSRRRWPTRRR